MSETWVIDDPIFTVIVSDPDMTYTNYYTNYTKKKRDYIREILNLKGAPKLDQAQYEELAKKFAELKKLYDQQYSLSFR